MDPMTKVFSAWSVAELAMLKSVLDGEGLTYFVRNEHFASLRIGPPVDLLNVSHILVKNEEADRARDLIDDFLAHVRDLPPYPESGFSGWDKLRMVLEFMVLGWFVPGAARSSRFGYAPPSSSGVALALIAFIILAVLPSYIFWSFPFGYLLAQAIAFVMLCSLFGWLVSSLGKSEGAKDHEPEADDEG